MLRTLRFALYITAVFAVYNGALQIVLSDGIWWAGVIWLVAAAAAAYFAAQIGMRLRNRPATIARETETLCIDDAVKAMAKEIKTLTDFPPWREIKRRLVTGENPVCPTCDVLLSRYRYGYSGIEWPIAVAMGLLPRGTYVEGGCDPGYDPPRFRCVPCREDFDHELDIKPSDTPAQRAEKARKTAIATIARWMKLHPDIWQEIEYVLSQDDNDKFALSMRRAIVQKGDLTDKQRVAIRDSADPQNH